MSMREPGSEQVTDPDDAGEYNSAWLLQREVDCLRLIKERTEVPVPAIYGYSAQAGNEIGASFMLMECFMGNVGMDLNFDHIPPEYNRSFLAATARIQDLLSEKTTEHTTLGLCQGWAAPLTGLQYSQAWAATAKFPRTDSCITDCCGPFAAEVLSSTHGFTRKIDELAPQLSLVSDQGPFPLCHVDFGHNNIIVDHEYNILAVIDWEHAFASPWETQYFPLTLHVTPPPMDLPENYDENGHPKDDKTKQKLADREFYVSAVRRSEEEGPDAASPALSEALGNDQIQSVVTAMRLFVDGKFGIYSKVLDMFVSSQENMES
ncbi:MAG: hypothetical protein M1819_000584 [Sarea resinae]|nr:MAG: hypothetical protein M1819_000584 [Sarea resinae]